MRKFDRLKSRPLEIKIDMFCNSFVINALQIKTIAGTQCAFQNWEPSYDWLSIFNTHPSLFPYHENKSETRTSAFPSDPRTDS